MYDLLIIGGGPGGYNAAERAGQAGLKVALFEKNSLGGVCLNEGCIPSKTLLNSAKLYRHAKDSSTFGVSSGEVVYEQAKVIKRKKRVVKRLVAGVKQSMKGAGVDVISANAIIEKPADDYFTLTADGESYQGKHLIIASGSDAVVPPIEGVREHLGDTVITNREILDLEEVPERLLVIGGGVIGLEMACYYQSVGSKVTVIEMLDHIAGNLDPEIGRILQEEYEKMGMDFHLSARVLSVSGNEVSFEENGETVTVSGDKILLSTGRRPTTEGFGLENLNLEFNRSAIAVNNKCQTSLPNVYAIGDVIGSYMLAHVAYREAEVAVNTILGIDDKMSSDAIPSVIYTDPEVAWVGKSEAELEAEGRTFEVVKLPMSYSGRYVAETERGTGICKLVLDKEDRTLLAAHMICQYASEIIISCGIMIAEKMTLSQMKKMIFPHPTVGEVIREALFQIKE